MSRPIWVYSAVALVYLLPLPLQALTHVIQVNNDASWQMWWLWWAKESLSHGHSPYFTGPGCCIPWGRLCISLLRTW